MDHLRIVRISAVLLSCLGMGLPAPAFEAAAAKPAPAAQAPSVQPRKPARDVELNAAGYLRGLVLDAEGVPVADAPVALCRLGQEVARVRTDAGGRFAIGPLRGGACQVSALGRGRLIRAWSAGTAPPGSKGSVLIVVGGDVVRGQMPLEEFFASDAVIICAMVAAMIAVPIAIHSSEPRSP